VRIVPSWHSCGVQLDSSPAETPEISFGTLMVSRDTAIDETVGFIAVSNCANSSLKL